MPNVSSSHGATIQSNYGSQQQTIGEPIDNTRQNNTGNLNASEGNISMPEENVAVQPLVATNAFDENGEYMNHSDCRIDPIYEHLLKSQIILIH